MIIIWLVNASFMCNDSDLFSLEYTAFQYLKKNIETSFYKSATRTRLLQNIVPFKYILDILSLEHHGCWFSDILLLLFKLLIAAAAY